MADIYFGENRTLWWHGLEMVQSGIVDPAKVLCPVMIVRAEHDGIATDADILEFFALLPNPDKQIVKIGGLAHTALLGVNRARFHHALHAFLAMPPRVDLEGRKGSGAGHA